MATSLRTLDDGAWLSVNDARTVGASEIWRLATTEFCACGTAHVLLESFYGVSVDGPEVAVGAVGQCIDCGEQGSIDHLPVGRIVDGEFRWYEPGTVQSTAEPSLAAQESPVSPRGGEN